MHVVLTSWTIDTKGPRNAMLYQDLPEFRDRVSFIGHHNRPGVMKDFSIQKMNERLARTDKQGQEWRELLEHEYKDRNIYNYPLFGVEK